VHAVAMGQTVDCPDPTVQPIRGGDSLFTTCWMVLDVAVSSGDRAQSCRGASLHG
jgi:hypothetical protein